MSKKHLALTSYQPVMNEITRCNDLISGCNEVITQGNAPEQQCNDVISKYRLVYSKLLPGAAALLGNKMENITSNRAMGSFLPPSLMAVSMVVQSTFCNSCSRDSMQDSKIIKIKKGSCH